MFECFWCSPRCYTKVSKGFGATGNPEPLSWNARPFPGRLTYSVLAAMVRKCNVADS